MRRFMLGSALALALAACGGAADNTKQALIDTCLADGDGDQAQCTCMAEQAIEVLDPKLVDMLVEASKTEDSSAFMASRMGELTPNDMQSLVLLATKATTECNMNVGQDG